MVVLFIVLNLYQTPGYDIVYLFRNAAYYTFTYSSVFLKYEEKITTFIIPLLLSDSKW